MHPIARLAAILADLHPEAHEAIFPRDGVRLRLRDLDAGPQPPSPADRAVIAAAERARALVRAAFTAHAFGADPALAIRDDVDAWCGTDTGAGDGADVDSERLAAALVLAHAAASRERSDARAVVDALADAAASLADAALGARVER